ncbi:MAG: sigma-70 family RNA polymerase sigma factor [Chloroflexi bacterium]|nr:sigma-70 family RNA polymerase sigma factor [Chloroflexota bacterium]
MIFLVLPDVTDDSSLLTRARRGEQSAVMEIYERYFQPIYQYVRLRTDDPSLSEDIAGNVFLKFVKSLRGGTAPRDHLRGWLFQVARNELSRHYGRSRMNTAIALQEWIPAPNEHEPEPQFIQQFEVERARSALRALSAEQQEVIVLRFGQALSLEETADVMGKSIDAIKSLQARAVRSLRSQLSDARVMEA